MIPLVLLHGFTGSPRSFDALRRSLPRSVRVLAPWIHGHGPRPAAPAVRTFEGEVDRLSLLLQRAGASRCHLVGYSLGARIALGLLVRHPHLVARATLLGPHPGLESEAAKARRSADATWIALLRQQGLEAFVEAWEAQPLLVPQPEAMERSLESRRHERLEHRAEGLAQALEHLGLGAMPNLRDSLDRVRCPVTVLLGAKDEKFREIWRRPIEAFSRGRLVLVPGAGHPLLIDAPALVATALAQEPA